MDVAESESLISSTNLVTFAKWPVASKPVSLIGKKGLVTVLGWEVMRPLPGSSPGAQMLLHLTGSAAQWGQISSPPLPVVQTCFPNSTWTPLFSLPRLPTFAPHLNSWVSQYGALIVRVGAGWELHECLLLRNHFYGKTDSSSSQADFIPVLGFLPISFIFSPVSTLLLSLLNLDYQERHHSVKWVVFF